MGRDRMASGGRPQTPLLARPLPPNQASQRARHALLLRASADADGGAAERQPRCQTGNRRAPPGAIAQVAAMSSLAAERSRRSGGPRARVPYAGGRDRLDAASPPDGEVVVEKPADGGTFPACAPPACSSWRQPWS